MTTTWIAVLAAGAISYLLKLSGFLVPAEKFEHPRVQRVLALMPAALLAALVVVQTVSDGARLVVDARVAAVAVAAVALLLRLPFLVVIVLAGLTAAGLRAAGWG